MSTAGAKGPPETVYLIARTGEWAGNDGLPRAFLDHVTATDYCWRDEAVVPMVRESRLAELRAENERLHDELDEAEYDEEDGPDGFLSQIGLIAAVCMYLGGAGHKLLSPCQTNAIIKAADSILAELGERTEPEAKPS